MLHMNHTIIKQKYEQEWIINWIYGVRNSICDMHMKKNFIDCRNLNSSNYEIYIYMCVCVCVCVLQKMQQPSSDDIYIYIYMYISLINI